EVLRAGESGPAVATELVGGSTTSVGTSEALSNQGGGAVPPELIKPLTDTGIPVNNPWIQFAETRTHGCAFATVSDTEVRAQYLGSQDVTTSEASRQVRTLADLRVARGKPGVEVLESS
ncbi:MAG: hypothetical protein ABIO51_06000, partial [Solirubrobacteraceae bacterium]